ncbi:MAG: GreA/GreB family elongation factor [Pseudomonadota bacterium]|nr:GreA/GreB family elongation factor [Pseudomonadota bacterium]
MSVAFRRDSDEEHLEPRFELPIPAGPNLVTAAGLAQAEARVAELTAMAATQSDEARLAETMRTLRYWRTRLATAELAPPPPESQVAFGSRVRFRLNGKEQSIDIVGDDEAAPADGRIAFSAPLARALIGAAVGDHADFAGAADAIEVLDIASI